MTKSFLSQSEEETKKIASGVALKLSPLKDKAVVIYLSGNLGAGKTVFTKGLLSSLGIKSRITSPTFTIFKRYPVTKRGFKNVYHFDCYRIKNSRELDTIGFRDILNNPQNIVLIEWPENIKKKIGASVRITIRHLPQNDARKISLASSVFLL